MSIFEREVATYNAHLPDLLARVGEFAVIKGDHLIGVFPNYEAALTAGYGEHLEGDFLVEEIRAEPRIHTFPRGLPPECLP